MNSNPRHVVIFGGSGAIGSAASRSLAREGSRLSLLARGSHRLESVAVRLKSQGAEVDTHPVDVLTPGALTPALDAAVERFGPVTGAVIAVSFPHDQGTLLGELDVETFIAPVDQFLRAHFLIAQAVAPRLAKGATIVSLSTPIARMTAPGHLGYAAACAGVEAFSRNLAHELAAVGARAVCVRPHAIVDAPAAGSYTADLFSPKAAALGLSVEQWLEGAAQSTMTGTLPTLAEVGDLVAFIVSGRVPSLTANVVDLTSGALVS